MSDCTVPNLQDALQLLEHYIPTIIKERDEARQFAEDLAEKMRRLPVQPRGYEMAIPVIPWRNEEE